MKNFKQFDTKSMQKMISIAISLTKFMKVWEVFRFKWGVEKL